MLGVWQNQSISYVFMHMKTQKKTHKFIQLPLPGVHCRFTSSRSSLRRLSLRLTVSTRFWNDNSTKKSKLLIILYFTLKVKRLEQNIIMSD